MIIIKKKFKISFFFSILLILIFILSAKASDQEDQLNKLFDQLKESRNNIAAQEVEKKIWEIWSTHPNNAKFTKRLAEGSELVRNNKLSKAVNIFTEVINLDPEWAEAWNKRATVLYMLGDFKASQKDIDEVLKLEERHFGALAGQGLVNIELKNYEKAIMSYKKAQEIYPSMQSPSIMIKQIEKLIKQDLI